MKTLKTTLSIISLLIAVMAINSCKKDDVLPEQSVSPVAEIDPESQKIINHLVDGYGFTKESIQEYPDEFIADGDIAFPKADFWVNYASNPQESQGANKHYRYTNLVNSGAIPVRFAANVPYSWRTAYINAMSRWNSLGGRVTFYYCNDFLCSLLPGINVSYENLGSSSTSTIAVTQYPFGLGFSGSYSKINSGLSGSLTTSQKLFTGVHELGHAIGIRHTDSGQGSLISTSIGSCNTGTDPSSVMRPFVGSFSAFTTCDVAAFKKLYP